MPRPYHSPSSIATGRRCRRAWAYQYIAGMRDPEVPWQESWAERLPEGVTSRMRSTALGKAMHAIAEAWYRHEPVAWTSYPAQVFLAGAHHLPHPERVHAAHVEQAIGDIPIPEAAAHAFNENGVCVCGAVAPDAPPCTWSHAPPTALEVHGVRFAGYKDLLVSAPGEFMRMGVDAPDGWLLVDYKSSANIARYALTPGGLLADVQANLYALDGMARLGLDELPARWVYFETKRKRVALPVDVRITRKHALTVLRPAAELAVELDAIECVDDATPNPDACEDYGGCVYHISRGGPCKARRSLGRSIAKGSKMANVLSPEMQAKLDAIRNGKGKGASAPADDGPTDPGPDTTEGTTEDKPAPAKPTRGRPAAKAKAPAGSLAETMSGLVDELTSAEALVADVRKRMGEALA